MRRILKFLVIIFSLLNVLINVSADLVATPHNNDFFMEHKDEMQIGSNYYMKAEKKLSVYESPASDQVIGTIEKGRVLHLHYIYEDVNGTMWGMQVLSDELCAWFKLNDMSEYYWNYLFYLDHESEFHSSGSKEIRFEDKGWLVLWEYPGSDMVSGTIKTSETLDYQMPVRSGWQYIDEEGVKWLNISYKGSEGWLNTNAPLSRTMPDVMKVYLSKDELTGGFSSVLIGGLVIGVCALTGILAVTHRKKK